MENFRLSSISNQHSFGKIELYRSTQAQLQNWPKIVQKGQFVDDFFPRLFLNGNNEKSTCTAVVTGDDINLLISARKQWNAIKDSLPIKDSAGNSPSPYRTMPDVLQNGSPIEQMRNLADQNLIFISPVQELNLYLSKLMKLMKIKLN